MSDNIKKLLKLFKKLLEIGILVSLGLIIRYDITVQNEYNNRTKDEDFDEYIKYLFFGSKTKNAKNFRICFGSLIGIIILIIFSTIFLID